MALFNKKSTSTEVKTDDKADKSMKDLYSAPTVKADKGSKKAINIHTRAYRTLVKPLVTEKGTLLTEMGKYLFVVENKANKIEVSKAIQDLYGVKPTKVNIILMEGKLKARGKVIGKRKDWKKAIVTLPKGKTLDLYEGV